MHFDVSLFRRLAPIEAHFSLLSLLTVTTLLFFGVINIHPGGYRCKFDVCNPSPLKSSSHSSPHSKRDDPCRHRGRDDDDDQCEDVEFRFHGWRILH